MATPGGAAEEFYSMSGAASGPAPYDKPAPLSSSSDPSYRPSRPTDTGSGGYKPIPIPSADPPSYRPQQPSGLSYPPPNNSLPSFPPPPATNGTTTINVAAPPVVVTDHLPAIATTATKPSLRDSRASTALALREYMNLQRARLRKDEIGIDERLRIQASTVLGDLQTLRSEVAELVEDAESHRWRRFLIGGAIAAFIPIVRKLFRRPKDERESSNDTEYAFKKSKSLVARILDSTRRPGIATVAFFVFAVMYVFQNEVSLRVARTVSKRLKRLSVKVEDGKEELTEDDLKLLQGWRWRVLMWS
ncbi:hypothetical protein B0H63DRAFT_103196 [Podospora didyma]|uniref:Uncharacterized protein n=1 Tax=Podospora didyma TaxID=330526 RepID=A0AAE0U3Y9_9PEZI|nr:hypothetical protein B0H63DRAFT_103196 [Podospora didyma]